MADENGRGQDLGWPGVLEEPAEEGARVPLEPEPRLPESAGQDSAIGPHGNPYAPGRGRRPPPLLAPGEAQYPVAAPDMTPTGAVVGQHPPAPPYEGPERRLAQHDWDTWRAEERRHGSHRYPEWRS